MGIRASKKIAKGKPSTTGLNPGDDVGVCVHQVGGGTGNIYKGKLVSLNQNGFVVIKRGENLLPVAIPHHNVVVVVTDTP